jgi:hypothetical protein
VVNEFVENQAKELSLQLFGVFEQGDWPFRSPKLQRKTRRVAPDSSAAFRKQRRLLARISAESRSRISINRRSRGNRAK